MPPRKNKRGDRGSIEDEPRNSKKSNMAAEENIDVEEPDERLNEQEEPSLFEIKALLVDIQIQVAAILTENHTLKKEIEDLKDSANFYGRELKDLKESLQKTNDENKELKNTLASTRNELKTTKENLESRKKNGKDNGHTKMIWNSTVGRIRRKFTAFHKMLILVQRPRSLKLPKP